MTNNPVERIITPCDDCLKADANADGRPMMCRQVAHVAITGLEKYCALDIFADARPEGIIAAEYLGRSAMVDMAVRNACKYLPKGRPLEQLSVLDRIQC